MTFLFLLAWFAVSTENVHTAVTTSNPMHATHAHGSHHDPAVAALLHRVAALEQTSKQMSTVQHSIVAEKKKLQDTVATLARQMMLQQLFVEERIRSDGDSGVKQTRLTSDGTRPYYTNTFTSGGVVSIHDHSNYDRTVGLGEFAAVLNGVEFRTRHNDYKLRMPHPTKHDYNAMVDIPFPDVPPSVLAKQTAAEQIAEMQQYFKAFHHQNMTLRNYEAYFKPVMCYLEAGWTTDTASLTEPFQSDRHHLDASSWFDMQEKIRYMSATGGKNNNENYSFLPTTIVNVTADGTPVLAQWNYRILCHPIKHRLTLKDLRPVDDLASRMHYRRNFTSFVKTRAARFTIAPYHSYGYKPELGSGTFGDAGHRFVNIDRIMGEIPGKDNYPGHLVDNAFDLTGYRVDTKNNTVLNTAFYHRWYKVVKRGAMGQTVRQRGYADQNMWTAQTSNPRIAEFSVNNCYHDSHLRKRVCTTHKTRSTYAIPLEVIWLSPLYKWNPYNLSSYTWEDRHSAGYQAVTAHGRNGGLDPAHAYNGTRYNMHYLTPHEFFHGGEVNRDPADTAKDAVGVIDNQGNVRKVVASGTRIFLPEIPGVGTVRMRYPVMPAHEEGSSTYKNLMALQDITMNMKKYTRMFEARPEIKDLDAHAPDQHYITSTTHKTPPGMHRHDVYLTAEQIAALHRNGTTVTTFSTEANGHAHELDLQLDPVKSFRLHIVSCDSRPTCWDGHGHYIYHMRT